MGAADTNQGASRSTLILTTAATGVVVVSVMPAFLVGASSVLLAPELGVDEAGIGLTMGTFYLASAFSAVFGGRLVDRLGPGRSLLIIPLVAAPVLVMIGLLVRELWTLLAFLALGGMINGMAQPASNLALSYGNRNRQGLMFGAKQAAIPLATLLAGASIPVVGVTLGWRWSFIAAGLLAMPSCLLPYQNLFPKHRVVPRGERRKIARLGFVTVMAVAMGLGTSAATTLAVFLIPTAVDSGLALDQAAVLALVGSFACIATRLASGWYSDQGESRRLLVIVAVMLAAGAAGFAMLASSQLTGVLAGAFIACSFGWGWTGVMMLACVRYSPNAAASVTGILQAGGATGAAAGPIIFGLLAAQWSYREAWAAAACGSILASVLVLLTATRSGTQSSGRGGLAQERRAS
ncbi:MFS transporter [Arthrobacter globiformis]|uniref:MFS transporter n=1 Tax=Arthrobacter globiformis TaxID=1665 RepID=UPI00278CD96C|nr:MFS transporter [Arthrobacter globiformis]MDQ0616670.1 MFS family permease [Arthrobacter globiformis]